MRPERSEAARLQDMLDSARAIQAFVTGKTFHDFQGSRLLRSAIEREIEIIGEAARFVTQETKDRHPDIPWQPIIVQRPGP